MTDGTPSPTHRRQGAGDGWLGFHCTCNAAIVTDQADLSADWRNGNPSVSHKLLLSAKPQLYYVTPRVPTVNRMTRVTSAVLLCVL